MINVTATFITNATKKNRSPEHEVLVDWELDGTTQDESHLVKLIEIERNISEPLGGVVLAQADITFVNLKGRFTARPESMFVS
jgi:hypothetical protein